MHCKIWEDENEKEKNKEKIAWKDVWLKGENEKGVGALMKNIHLHLYFFHIYIYIYIYKWVFFCFTFFYPSNILILNKVQNIDIQGQFCIFKKDIYSTASFHSNLLKKKKKKKKKIKLPFHVKRTNVRNIPPTDKNLKKQTKVQTAKRPLTKKGKQLLRWRLTWPIYFLFELFIGIVYGRICQCPYTMTLNFVG